MQTEMEEMLPPKLTKNRFIIIYATLVNDLTDTKQNDMMYKTMENTTQWTCTGILKVF